MQTIPEEKKNGNKDAQVPSPEMLSHSTDTPRQNASSASLMTLTGCRVCSGSSFATYTTSIRVSASFVP